jgi:uncharacterized protein YprB with RNaseH-like and TPR domain
MFGDSRALERLIAYNREDCVNLERLAEVAYEGMRDMVFETGNAELGTRSLESLPL